MPNTFPKDRITDLIEEVHGYPLLWNKTMSDYKDSAARQRAWEKVALILNVNSECRA